MNRLLCSLLFVCMPSFAQTFDPKDLDGIVKQGGIRAYLLKIQAECVKYNDPEVFKVILSDGSSVISGCYKKDKEGDIFVVDELGRSGWLFGKNLLPSS